ncbi:zinc finger protein 622 [Aphidius gifuensis]|uniref:zinc finger protein 622 n=1 Tax=Aphidius gifuensis TaxID=684658 RepID=UPI001CDCEA65|nr:zinc finger protein 622 [Aphidius gifuensis]
METDSVIGNNQFTCITCRVAFRDLEIQRLHYKSDWHRYNLKRKVAELPPITSEEFQKRVLVAHQADLKKVKPATAQCKMCHKNFNTINQYENHIMSKKHHDNELKHDIKNHDDKNIETSSSDTDSWTLLPPNNDTVNAVDGDGDKIKLEPDKIESMDTESDAESVESDEDPENPVKNNDCLFCDHHSRSWVRNLKHMSEKHSFFLADFDHCIDPKGLLEWLGEKVYVDHVCIWCNVRVFRSSDAVRAHMIDKGHCKMIYEGALALEEYEDYYDFSSSFPDAEDYDADDDHNVEPLDFESEDFLTLPSGTVIGHRSLLVYFNQKPHQVVAIPQSEKIRKVLRHYRALGWTGSEKAQIAKKARDIKYMQRIRSKYSTQLNFKANKFQKHYREQVNF